MQLQHQQQLQQQLPPQQHPNMPPSARHHQHPGGNPGHTMTMNRKVIDKNHYNEDTPPPLPPLRNPQKALDPVQAIPSLNDSSISERDKQIYICSSLKNPNNHNTNNSSNNSNNGQTHPNTTSNHSHGSNPYGTMKQNPNTLKNQTTFNSTLATTTKPLPSIINTPLPEIPKQSQLPAPKDDIYVKRKLIEQNSKFATLKAIPMPKIEALDIETQKKKMAQTHQQKTTHTPNGMPVIKNTSLLPPPPVTTASGTMTASQIQSLPLPPPPPELIEEEPLPPPPPPIGHEGGLSGHDDLKTTNTAKTETKEVIYATKVITNHANSGTNGNHGGSNGDIVSNPTSTNNTGDESSFYAVTEL
ncbi:transcription factor mef2A-like [Topomyia yanbarensis]|uniref:transcription factor mef2A-like n=1 Tax=Topomyia yanbarensis TaxID=2498891 RepID=UPI00273C6A94|nr:transcription factor mef2A-like [Topomyia yanbarensis]